MSTPSGKAPVALVFVGTLDEPRVAGALREHGLAPVAAIAPETFPDGPIALAVIDPDLFGPRPAEALADAARRLGPSPVVFLSGACDRDRLAALVGLAPTLAIVPRDHFTSDRELREAIRCRAGAPAAPHRGPFEGLVARTARTRELPLHGTEDRDRALEEVSAFFAEAGVRRRLVAHLQDAAEELVTNALYDAPVDAAGRPLFAMLDRRQPVTLPPGGVVTLALAADDQHAGVAVRDPYGSLAGATARRYIAKGLRGGPDQIDSKEGGAGLGLTRVYQMVDHLAIRTRPGLATEIVCLLETGGARRDMASRPSSLLVA